MATGEVGRDRQCRAIETPSLPCSRAAAPCAFGRPWDTRSPWGPGPPAALQVGAAGSPESVARRGRALPGVAGATTRHRVCPPSRATTALPLLPRPVGPGRADPCRADVGRVPASGAPPPRAWRVGPREALPHSVPTVRGYAGVQVGPESPGQVRDHPNLISCLMGSWASGGDCEECLGHLWPLWKAGRSGVGSVWASGGVACGFSS